MMKLFALRDQATKERKGFGREHALDIYTLVATLTEEEYEKTFEIASRYAATPVVAEAKEIVASLFADTEALGVLRLREHQLCPPQVQIPDFLEVLQRIFAR